MNCTLCNSLLTEQIDLYYLQCSTCGSIVKHKQFYISSDEEKQRYQMHNNDVNDVRYQAFTSPITNFILEHCKPDDLGLDYGCGTGPVIATCLQEKKYKVVLFDPYFYPDATYQNNKYHYIYSCEVFEHFYHPYKEIKKLVQLLHDDGFLIVMTHLFLGKTDFLQWYYRKDPTHVFIYTPQSIAYISTHFSLKVKLQNERMVVFQK